jgi:thiamine pyrophosphokinase
MRVLILVDGSKPERETAQMLAARHDLLIAVDGAVYSAAALGLKPDVLTGDFDSVRLESVCLEHPNMKVIPTPDQDRSDMEKALTVASELGATSITVMGAAGGRMDHTLANTAILLRAGTPMVLADDLGTVRALGRNGEADEAISIETSAGDTVSLITFERDTTVSIAGVRWPLDCYHLPPGTLGVSNVSLGSAVNVIVHKGSAFVCHLYQAALREHSLQFP